MPPKTKAGTDKGSTAGHSQLVAVSLEGLPVQILSHLDALSMFCQCRLLGPPPNIALGGRGPGVSPCPAPNEPVTWGESDP